MSIDTVVPPPVKFWIAQESEGKAVNPIKVLPAESKGYILEIADLPDTLRGIFAMANGVRMQFAVRYKNQPVDVVVAFSAQMSEVERAPLMNCLVAVGERPKKWLRKKLRIDAFK